MASNTSESGPEVSTQDSITSSDIFATVQQLSSQINDNCIQRIDEAVKDLTPDESQLIVDLLGIALEKYHYLLMNPDRVLSLLVQIASSAKVMARNHILDSDQLISNATSPGVYTVPGELPLRVRVIKKGNMGTPGMFSKVFISWVHLSHTNILPVYGVFLDGKSGPISIVSPSLHRENIVEYAKTLVQVERVPLISDVIVGLCYLHQLNIIHGSLCPESILILENGRALITVPDALSETSTTRYTAPEILDNEDTNPTKAADVWAVGCLCYEVLSGNVPFCQYRQEVKVALAVVKGKQPTRPGRGGVGGEEIGDITWRPISACWEFEPEDRPSCHKVHDAFSGMNIHDGRPVPKLVMPSTVMVKIKTSKMDLERARSLLIKVLGSEELLQPPSRIPEHLRVPLFGLGDNLPKAYAVAAAAKKLSPDDTQTLLDALDLVLEESPSHIIGWNPVMELMEALTTSTHIFPSQYKLRRIRYDPSPIAEYNFGKAYKSLDLDVCVNVVTNSKDVAGVLEYLTFWAHLSHQNVLPFYGILDEAVNEVPRFCVISPYMKNGTLHEYAPHIPQESRIPLISDVIEGLSHLHKVNICPSALRPDIVLISDEGRALIASFNVEEIVTCTPATKTIRSSASYTVRFHAPEFVKARKSNVEANIWSFGCLCYEVVSGKPPYHQHTEKDEVLSILTRGEPPIRPSATDNNIEEVEDRFWELIMGCCKTQPEDRLLTREIQNLLATLKIQDDRPNLTKLPGSAIMGLRKRLDIDWNRVEQLLGQIQIELLRSPLSKLTQNHIKDIAAEAAKLSHSDVQTLVDFLDVTLKDHLTISDDRNRVLALLSRITTLSQVFPQRHEIKGIKYDPIPIAEGGFGKVHRGNSDPSMCVKVTTRVNDSRALAAYIKELILWAHSSHPNVLPFYGVFMDDSQQICLVSPYMEKGNLSDYACQLPQKSRIPLLLDTIKGLDYLHGLGIVHTDLKGVRENVLISDEGRGLITDFGASHVVTATAKGGATSQSVATTLRFTAPELIEDPTRRVRPTKECDIWSFGCLCYQVLSRKVPYNELQFDAQVFAALIRGQLPKRPGPTQNDTDDDSDNDWDDFDEKDWDDLDDTTWSLITKCLVPKPAKNRPSTSQIQELIVDMKAWDSRPVAKGVPGAEILKQKPNVEVNLNHIGTLLDHLQILFLARSICRYTDQDVIAAVAKLKEDDTCALIDFWASTLKDHLSSFADKKRLLAINSAVIVSQQWSPAGYFLQTRPIYHPKAIAEGSFGKVYRGSEMDVCIKVAKFSQMNRHLLAQWDRVLAPWAHSSHPNILPFYGVRVKGGGHLVSPFIRNGTMHDFAPHLPQKSRTLLISDVIDGLIYLHQLGIIHSNIKTQNVLVSDEGRGLITDFRPYYICAAAATDGPTGSYITSTLRFTAPELVKNNQILPTTASDIWSVGCLIYEVLSRKVPYYKYAEDHDIRSSLTNDEIPERPILADGDSDEIDDESWDLITQCCSSEPGIRPSLVNIQKRLRKPEDNRPTAKSFPGAELLKLRESYKDIDVPRFGEILDNLKAHLPKLTPEGEKDDEDQN